MQKKIKNSIFRSAIYIIIFTTGIIFYKYGRSVWVPIYYKYAGKRTVQDVIKQYGNDSRSRLNEYFNKAGVQYPPKRG